MTEDASKKRIVARLILTCVILSLLVVPLAAYKPAAAASAAYSQMVVGVAQAPDTLNVFSAVGDTSRMINFLVYDTLTSVQPNLSAGPQLAHSWDLSPDGTVWTFHLVQNATWHDGHPVTASDVSFTYNLILDNPTDVGSLGEYLTDVVSVVATDTYDVQVTTSAPRVTVLSIMIPILPEHVWSLIDPSRIDSVDPWDSVYFPDGPVGSGPLRLVEYDPYAEYVVLERNPDYFLGTVKADQVLFLCFNDGATMTDALSAGTIDVAMDVPRELWSETLAHSNVSGQSVRSLELHELGINCASEQWRQAFPKASSNLETTNLSVRQAIAMATNKSYIVDELMGGYAEPGGSIVPPSTQFWHYSVPAEDVWDSHVEQANALLDDAGYDADLDGDGIRENSTSGVELNFSLYYRYNNPDDVNCAVSLAGWLSQIGIYADLNGVSEGVLYNVWLNCEYDLFIWSWQADADPDFILSVMTEAQYPIDPYDFTGWGDAFWVNELYEQLYLCQLSAVDIYDRQAIVLEMQQMLYYHCPYVVLWYPFNLVAYRTDTFTNYPNMGDYPGNAPDRMWFYFGVTPVDSGEPSPPSNVDAGEDCSVYYGEIHSFAGTAEDADTPIYLLNWSWEFVEPDSSVLISYGQTVQHTFLNLGTVVVTLTVTDPEGLWSNDSLLVHVGLPPPVTEVTLSGTEGLEGWFLSAVEVSLSASSMTTVETTLYSVDNTTWETYAGQFSVIGDGFHTIEYYSVDDYGNEEEAEQAEFGIDTTPPITSVSMDGLSGIEGWYRSEVCATLLATDETSGVRSTHYTSDGVSWILYDGDIVFAEDGDYELMFLSEDIAGNTEDSVAVEFHIDRISPQLTILTPSAGSVTSVKNISWECYDNSGIAVVELSTDGSDWLTVDDGVPQSSGVYALEIPDGAHVATLRIADLSGNEVLEEVSFIIDTSAPEITIDNPANQSCVSDTVELSWTCSDEYGIARIEIQVDDGLWNETAAESAVLELSEGWHEAKIRVTDVAGNPAVATLCFLVDGTDPVVEIVSPSAGAKISKDTVTVTWTGTDNLSGIDYFEVRLNDGAWVNAGTNTSFTFTDLDDNWYTISVRAVDRSGNAVEAEIDVGIYTSIWSTNGPYNGIPLFVVIASVALAGLLLVQVYRRWMIGREPPPAA